MHKYDIGNNYTRTEIRKIESDPGTMGKWDRGYLEHKSEIFIFSTFDGEAYTGVDHGDKWIDETDGIFYWNGMRKSNITHKHIKMMLDPSYKVHLFTRKSDSNKSKLKGAPFTYQGLVLPIKVSGRDPVNIIWKVNNRLTPFIELDHLKNENEIFQVENRVYNDQDKITYKEKEQIKRSNQLKINALEKNDSTCEINPLHKTFVSKRTKKQYMEIHHIIPISAQNYYNFKLDCLANISCLCPNCHRLIHYGIWEEKEPLLKLLYQLHIDNLKKSNIDLKSMEEIAIYYK